MPIKPENRALYPKDWKQIRQRILARAENKCEDCGVPNYAVGARDKMGAWHDEREIHNLNSDVGEYMFGDFPNMVRIILTIAHLDHNPGNNDPGNLRALCQLHHNRLDVEHRKETRGATIAARKRASDPQLSFGDTWFDKAMSQIESAGRIVDKYGAKVDNSSTQEQP